MQLVPGGDTLLLEESLKRKIQGLLLFRLVLAVFFLCLTLFVQIYREADLFSPRLFPLYIFSLVLFVFTLFGALGVRSFRRFRRQAYCQLCFDVGAVTVLIYLSGGVDSLFSFLYMPVIISAALLLYRRGGLLIAAACSLAYGLLLDLQFFGWIEPMHVLVDESYGRDTATYFHTLLMNIAGFFLVAFLSGYLAEQWLKSSEEAERQKKSLERLASLHHHIVESIQSGLLTINMGGTVVFSNPSARNILGVEADHIHGKHFSDLLPHVDLAAWPQGQGASRYEGREYGNAGSGMKAAQGLPRSESVYIRPSGDELIIGYTVSILQGPGGEKLGWVFIFQDLTQVRAMQNHVQRLERLALAGRIAAEISHEIKNPLAAMSGSVQMLLAETVPGSIQGRLLGIVHREIDRINGLITDFLWLTRGARKADNMEEVAVCPVIVEIVEVLKTQSGFGSGHRVRMDFRWEPVLSLDGGQFRQVMWNLVLNALEAMPQGGEVFLGVMPWPGGGKGKKPSEVRIDIRDTGPGIAEDIRDKVFEPFFTTKADGTGLGLGVTYQLMENMGGRIEMSSNSPTGTTFSLFFPL